MAKQLTDRQREIVTLLDQGKTPREAAEALDITENAVYQHIRRIREGGHKVTSASNAQGSRSRGRSTARTRQAPATAPEAPATATPAEPRAMTPLQAIRYRRATIEQETKAAHAQVLAAEKVLAQAREAAERVLAKHGEELDHLISAEAALTGKPAPKPPAKPRSRSRSASKANGSTPATPQAQTSAAPAPEPAEGDPGNAAVDAAFSE